MSEQHVHQPTDKTETKQQNNHQKGEKYETTRQGCSGLLRRRQRVP